MRAAGNFLGVGVNPQLWFGHGPPIPGTLVPLVAVGLVLLGGCVWFVILPPITGHRRLPSPVPHRLAQDRSEASLSPPSAADPIDRLERLADLHDRGALTDAEFEAEKANVISEADPR